VEKIHAYPNHCILYREDTSKDLDKCTVCSASWYKNNAGYYGGDNQGPSDVNKRKGKGVASVEPDNAILSISERHSGIPSMAIWYLPIFDRLRCFFSNPKDAELVQ